MIDLKQFKEPFCIVLVGLPGSGKTTLREGLINQAIDLCLGGPENNLTNAVAQVSSDDYIEDKAKELGKDYNEIFKEYVNAAGTYATNSFNMAVSNRQNIIVDRTNVNAKSRRKFLSQLPKTYTKIAIVLAPEENTLIHRLKNRTDKHISFEVVADMIDRFEPPYFAEGFESIITIQENDTSKPDYLAKELSELVH